MAPDEQPAVLLFLSLDTQWLKAGVAGVSTGLDYSAIEPTARGLRIEVTPEVFQDLRLMERHALTTWAEASR